MPGRPDDQRFFVLGANGSKPRRGIMKAEINHHIGFFDQGQQVIAQINLADDLQLRAAPGLPAANARTMRLTSRGMRLEATLTTPCAPTAMNGSVNESSPLNRTNLGPRTARSWLTRSALPPASLRPTMFLHSCASRWMVSTPISTPQRPGML